MTTREKSIKIEIIIFILLLFFQNFALITTKNFGIAALTIFLIYVFMKYQFLMRMNSNFLKFIGIFTFFILISCIWNQKIYIMQIIRTYMILFIIWTTYQYISMIKEKGYQNNFIKIFYNTLLAITIYGIYQLIASNLKLPMFLNIFSNNPSYAVRGIFDTYTGWNESGRIYTTFYEPSAYATFLTIAYFFVMNHTGVEKKKKILISILVVLNIIFSYARSAWIMFIYFIAIYVFFKVFKKGTYLKAIGKILIILLPLITLVIMSTIGIKMFTDLSSKARTYSPLYYLENSFDSIKSVLVGHGRGSILNQPDDIIYHGAQIEKFTHNGYVEIVYELGWVMLIFIIISILRYFRRNHLENKWIAYATVFTLCCFGSMYSVESIIAMVCIVLKLNEQNIKKGKEKMEQ